MQRITSTAPGVTDLVNKQNNSDILTKKKKNKNRYLNYIEILFQQQEESDPSLLRYCRFEVDGRVLIAQSGVRAGSTSV
jgi:hypothetical protein